MADSLDEKDIPCPTGSLVGFSISPLWHASQLRQQESAMRSTQSAVAKLCAREQWPGEETPQPLSSSSEVFRLSDQIHPSDLRLLPIPASPGFGLSQRLDFQKSAVDSTTFFVQYGRFIPGFAIDMHELNGMETTGEGKSIMKEHRSRMMSEGDDRTYHVRHIRGETYSGRYEDDALDQIPDQAVQFIKDMQQRRCQAIWLTACIKLVAKTKSLLEMGRSLVLERTSCTPNQEPIACHRPGCLQATSIFPHHYYLQILGDDSSYLYCLICFERLWKGRYTGGRLPEDITDEHVFDRRDSVMETEVIPQVDGTWDTSSPVAFDTACTSSQRDKNSSSLEVGVSEGQESENEDNNSESPSSVMSDREWRYPPTAFQRIAASIKPGDTISASDRVALAYWKLVSHAQLHWEVHTRKAKDIRDYYNDPTGDDIGIKALRVEHRKEALVEEEHVDEDALELEVGLQKRDVYGTDLSEVLRKVADVKHQS